MPSVIGQRLAELRKQHKLSGQKLADKIGVTQSYISYIEHADNPSPNVELLNKMAKIFNVSTDYLTGASDTPQINNIEKIRHLVGVYGIGPQDPLSLLARRSFSVDLREWLDKTPGALEELAQRAHTETSDIEKYASGKIQPSNGQIMNLLQIMMAMGWNQKEEGDKQSTDKKVTPILDVPSSRGDIVRIPILSPAKSACCGAGFPNSEEIYAEMTDYLDMPSAIVGTISPDPELRPYFIYADGDSMINAGIIHGSYALVNPAEPVYDGESALVSYGVDSNVAIKRVYWLDNGAVRITSADGTDWSRTFTREDIQDEKIFRIIGKIMFAGVRPKRG